MADDPWEGHTLEWAAPSPPPLGNFPEAPTVSSATPLLDRRSGPLTAGTADTAVTPDGAGTAERAEVAG
jgi:heme/copper-type cytochrome/quinol oxidase subunit 1